MKNNTEAVKDQTPKTQPQAPKDSTPKAKAPKAKVEQPAKADADAEPVDHLPAPSRS